MSFHLAFCKPSLEVCVCVDAMRFHRCWQRLKKKDVNIPKLMKIQ